MILINDLFPSRRAISESLVGSDFAIQNVERSATGGNADIPSNGCLAIITNKSYGSADVLFFENKTDNSVRVDISSGDHVAILYSRTSSIDLGIVALAVVGPNFNAMVDDLTPSNAQGSLLIIPNGHADLDAIYNKYHTN